ncbi:unnamed protein product [Allacma fusca]|uniref:Uncharacterized protein n=1 Tax=Allacma fusca TaxID=39272 RepID=A0A8J2L5F2_9HEXA|nr:unnamed protein product [Allacma fusca]
MDTLEIDRSERDSDVRAKILQMDRKFKTFERNIATIKADQTNLKGRTAAIEGAMGRPGPPGSQGPPGQSLNNAKIKTNIANSATPESFLKMLPPPENGFSFGGSTFEQIAAALKRHSMAVKFVNYMDTDLTGYQLELYYGSAGTNAPTTISSQTAQVATFKPAGNGEVLGTMIKCPL